MSIIEENWSYFMNLGEMSRLDLKDFELYVIELSNNVLKLLEDSFLQNSNDQVSSGKSYDEEHKVLTDKNRQLRQEIEVKLKELSGKQTQYESYKKSQKVLSQEVKETHEAFLMAKKFFKKFLKIYYSIESRTNDKQVIFIQFFTEAKKDSENYSVRLIRNINSKQYSLLTTTPKLKMFKEFQEILQETNDVPGALYCFREEFMAIKGFKK